MSASRAEIFPKVLLDRKIDDIETWLNLYDGVQAQPNINQKRALETAKAELKQLKTMRLMGAYME